MRPHPHPSFLPFLKNGTRFLPCVIPVTFALPDGSLADWTPCSTLPADNYCWHRGGVFEYYIYQSPAGELKVVEGFPPAIGLLVE